MDVVKVLSILEDKDSFKFVVDQLPLHAIVTDENGVIIYANKAAAIMTGYDVNEIIGQTPALWGKQMGEEFYKNMWDTIKNKRQVFTGVITNKRKTGELYRAAARIAPIVEEIGLQGEKQLVGFISIENDITHLEEMKQKYNISEEDINSLYQNLFKS